MRARRSEHGIALIAALLFSVTVLALITAVLSSGIAVRTQSRYIFARQGAQQAAESGVHLTLARLNGPLGPALLATGGVAGVLRGTGDRAPAYDVTVQSGGADSIDNDLDGTVDEADEADLLEITSTGSFDGIRRTVRVTLLARYATPEGNSAVHIGDPMAELDFKGNAFLISGYDVDLNGDPTGYVGPGIGVVGDPSFLVDQIKNQQTGNVVGSGESPSVVEVTGLDLHELVEEGARSANVVLSGSSGTVQPGGEGEWGTLDAPAIVYAAGSVHISGGAEGAGLLIVNGNLTITGGFEWHGLIIVSGELEFKGGGGGKRLIGGLVVQNDVFAGLPEWEDEDISITMTGTVDVMLSRQTIARISKTFASYTILNWREGPNPEEALP